MCSHDIEVIAALIWRKIKRYWGLRKRFFLQFLLRVCMYVCTVKWCCIIINYNEKIFDKYENL